MLPVQRRSETMGLLSRQPTVRVEDLATHMSVSLSTVRRDLDELEREGVVRRVHGGAVLTGGSPVADEPELPPGMREVVRRDEKHAIARGAVGLIEPGSAVLLTGGTTTAALAPLLATVPDVMVVTNSLDVAIRLAGVEVDLVMLGGALRRPELSLLGSLTTLGLGEVHVDHVVMGVYGVDGRSGLLGASAQESEMDRHLVSAASRVTILADSSKFSRRSSHRIADLSIVSELITSTLTSPSDIEPLRALGLTVHVV